MVSHTDPSSLANLYQPQDEVAKGFSNVVRDITSSAMFHREDFLQHQLTLAEAYCLIWQDSETGDLDGRRFGLPLKMGAYAALFIDLIAIGKLHLSTDGDSSNHDAMFTLQHDTPTESYLDDILLDHIRFRHKVVHGKPMRLRKWLERADETDCVDDILGSLIRRGVLSKESTGFLGIKLFKKFPTIDPEPERVLESKIKDVAFYEKRPDSFILALLALSREADAIFMTADPILRKHFPDKKYAEAKKNLDTIIHKFLGKKQATVSGET